MSGCGADFATALAGSGCDYAYVDRLSPSDWAWEFLRRNSEYRADFLACRARLTRCIFHISGVLLVYPRGVLRRSEKWGLAHFSDPSHHAAASRIFWLPSAEKAHASVYMDHPVRSEKPPDVDLEHDTNCMALLCQPDKRILLARTEIETALLQLGGANPAFGPVDLRFEIDGFSSLERASTALKIARRVLKSSSETHDKTLSRTTELNRKKALVALDCALAGASLQQTAKVFQSLELTRLEWSSSGDEALKKQVWRFRNTGLKLMRGDYRKFLSI